MSNVFSKMMKVLVLYLPFTILAVLVLPMIHMLFINIESDETTKVTNLGFAIVAAVSALCFSWNRSVTEIELQTFTSKQGERSLFIAILFIVFSGIKYGVVSLRSLPFLDSCFVSVCQLIVFPILSLSFTFLITVTFWILFRLALQLWEDYDFTKKWPG